MRAATPSTRKEVASSTLGATMNANPSLSNVHESPEVQQNASTSYGKINASASRSELIDASGDNVKVICRVRPFDRRELNIQASSGSGEPIRSVILMEQQDTILLDHTKDFTERERFHFDYSIWSIPESQQENHNAPYASQEDVFQTIGLPALEQCWLGYNTSLFAYGQTGSGKTHTMMGPEDDPGMIPRLCQELFKSVQDREMKDAQERIQKGTSDQRSAGLLSGVDTSSDKANLNEIKEYIVEARFMEIYKERAHDLLYELKNKNAGPLHNYNERESLKVRNFPGRGPDVIGLTTITVSDWESCVELINHGIANRTVASTKMNEQSSRSHCLFRLVFTQKTTILRKKVTERAQILLRSSQINLVDLAGSERNKKSGARGEQLKEAASINKSLTVLKDVIDALVERKPYIPYRDSLLTWLLSESLGGNAKTFMIACVSPHYDNAEETLNTLRYALRARGIKNKAEVNDSDDMKRMERLRAEIVQLQQEVEKGPSQDLQQELTSAREMLNMMQSSLQEADTQAHELREAYRNEMERRYAASFLTGFRLSREHRQADLVHDYASTLVQQLRETNDELKQLQAKTQDVELSITNMQEAEAALRDSVSGKQRTLDGILEVHRNLEQKDLAPLRSRLEELALIRKKYENSTLWDRTHATLMEDAMRTRLSEHIHKEFETYRKDKESIIRAQSQRAIEYENRQGTRLQDLEKQVTELKKLCEALARRVETTRSALDQRYTTLKLEKHKVQSAIAELSRTYKERHDTLWNEHMYEYESKHEELLHLLSSSSTRSKETHVNAVYAIRRSNDELEKLWQTKMDDAKKNGKNKIEDLEKKWMNTCNTYTQKKRESLLELEATENDLVSVVREARRAYKGRSISVEEVERALQHPKLKKFLIDSGYGYHSITPTFYTLARAPTLYTQTDAVSLGPDSPLSGSYYTETGSPQNWRQFTSSPSHWDTSLMSQRLNGNNNVTSPENVLRSYRLNSCGHAAAVPSLSPIHNHTRASNGVSKKAFLLGSPR